MRRDFELLLQGLEREVFDQAGFDLEGDVAISRVVIEAADMATYPDLSIVCGPDQEAKAFRHAITNPTVLIEVLSPSTERYDRGAKFEQYRKLESLREYVLISQDAMAVDLFRLENGRWVFHQMRGEDAMLSLASVGIEILLRDIYRGVNFEDAE